MNKVERIERAFDAALGLVLLLHAGNWLFTRELPNGVFVFMVMALYGVDRLIRAVSGGAR